MLRKFFFVFGLEVTDVIAGEVPNTARTECPCTLRNTVDFSRNHLAFCSRNYSSLKSCGSWDASIFALAASERIYFAQRVRGGDLRAYRGY